MKEKIKDRDVNSIHSLCRITGRIYVQPLVSIKKLLAVEKHTSFDETIVDKYPFIEKEDLGDWEFGIFNIRSKTFSYFRNRIQNNQEGWKSAKAVHLLTFAKEFKDLVFDKKLVAAGDRQRPSHREFLILYKEGEKRIIKSVPIEELEEGAHYYLIVRKIENR